MGPDATLRSRRNAAQRHALAPLERQIRAADPYARRQYLRDFSLEFRSYEAVLAPDELLPLYAAADVVLVGDYHALARSQEFAADLVEALARQRPVVLALETVFARDQAALEAWSRGELGRQQLRDRIRFDVDWGYDWAPFLRLLEAARAGHAPIYGLDCMPRDDLRRIGVRDRHAAAVIDGIRRRHPAAAVVVLFGESHLASNHLPAPLRARRPEDRLLTVLQNVDPLYWQAAGERRQPVAAVRVRPDVVCVFNATPLEKYESYRLFLERWQDAEGPPARDAGSSPAGAKQQWARGGGKARPPDLVPAFYHLVEGLLRFLNVDKPSPSPTSGTQPRLISERLPQIYVRPGAARVRLMLRRKGVRGSAAGAILRAFQERGCCFVPEMGAVLIDDFQLNDGAEAAARAVHHMCRRGPAPASAQPSPEDRFYGAVLESALGDFGARALCPARPPVGEAELLRRDGSSQGATAELSSRQTQRRRIASRRKVVRVLDLLALHKHYEANLRRYAWGCGRHSRSWELHQHYEANLRRYRERPRQLAELMALEPALFACATRWLGHLLGTELYDAYLSSHMAKRFLRTLYCRDLSKPGAARTLYFRLQRQLGSRRQASAPADGIDLR